MKKSGFSKSQRVEESSIILQKIYFKKNGKKWILKESGIIWQKYLFQKAFIVKESDKLNHKKVQVVRGQSQANSSLESLSLSLFTP